MKTILLIMFITASCLVYGQASYKAPRNDYDPLLPSKGKFYAGAITTYTGNPPPVLIMDVTYGLSKKTSIGLVGGTTGTLALMGFKLNTTLFQREKFRSVFRLNAIYYPERNGTFLFDKEEKYVMAWMFTMGVADLEWKTQRNTRWSVGLGFLETHCIEGMMNWFANNGEGGPLPMKWYSVIHGGVSMPLSSRLTLRPEVIIVMKDFRLVNKEADKAMVNPVNPFINLTYAFGRRR